MKNTRKFYYGNIRLGQILLKENHAMTWNSFKKLASLIDSAAEIYRSRLTASRCLCIRRVGYVNVCSVDLRLE